MKGGRRLRHHGLTLDLAGGSVDAGRHVAGHHGCVLRVESRHRRGERLTRDPFEARAQERVEHHPRPLEQLRGKRLRRPARQPFQVDPGIAAEIVERCGGEDVHLVAVLPQQARGHEAVPAVVSPAHHDPNGPRTRRRGADPGEAEPGSLHEVERRDALILDGPGVDRPHLGGLVEGIEPIPHARGPAVMPGRHVPAPTALRVSACLSAAVSARLRVSACLSLSV